MLKEMTVVQLKEMLRERGLKLSGRKAELIERIQEFDEAIESPAQDVPADEPTLVSKPITAFEGRTTLGKFIKSGIASRQYSVIHSDGYDFLIFNDQLCASEGYDSVTAVAEGGEIVKVYRLSSRGVSETCFEGDELRRL